MKKIIAIALLSLALAALYFGCKKEEQTGTIYGVVTDFATGEPIKTAGVELLPTGLKTVTGSDGTFQFTNVELGEYELFVTKTGYVSTKKSGIQLKGESVQYDVQVEKLPAALRVVDDNGIDINVLDFGYENDDVSRLFNIFNDSESSLSWQITTTANWIQSVSESGGTLPAGVTKGIIVVIDRSKLQQGINTTTLHITSDNGNKQLTVKATREDISTLEATSVTANSAVLNGKINQDFPYTERGFYYGTNHNLSSHITVAGNGTGAFSTQITGLAEENTYYFKAYCIYNGTYLYGEEKSFGPYIPTFEFNGHTYMVAPDPGSTMDWETANAYCNNLTLYDYTDWRLPTKDELMQMYTDRTAIGGFDDEYQTGYYWSSTQYGEWHHYLIHFWNGGVYQNGSITITHRVRPIRVAN